jgi:hypothetical protein
MWQLVEQTAYFIWLNHGQPDGDSVVDYGFGEVKLRDFHWAVACFLHEIGKSPDYFVPEKTEKPTNSVSEQIQRLFSRLPSRN